jgi:hypothetical protein
VVVVGAAVVDVAGAALAVARSPVGAVDDDGEGIGALDDVDDGLDVEEGGWATSSAGGRGRTGTGEVGSTPFQAATPTSTDASSGRTRRVRIAA